MRIEREGVIHEIDIHYGFKGLVVSSYKKGAKDYLRHSQLKTFEEIQKEFKFDWFSLEHQLLRQMVETLSYYKVLLELQEKLKDFNIEKQRVRELALKLGVLEALQDE